MRQPRSRQIGRFRSLVVRRIPSLLITGALLAALPARAEDVYLKEQDAAKVVFPDSSDYTKRMLELTDAELAGLNQLLGRQTTTKQYPYLEVHKGGALEGYIFLLDVVGQTLPISFAVGVVPGGRVQDLEVMVYREPRGEAIREARFRKQFVGKQLRDPLTLGKDVDAISGATISSRSAAWAARKALALAAVLQHRSPPSSP